MFQVADERFSVNYPVTLILFQENWRNMMARTPTMTIPVVTVMLLLAMQCELAVDARVVGVDILLDPKDLAKTGDLRNTIATIKKIGQALVGCGVKDNSQMRKRMLTNRTVTCNDGSPAG